MNNVDVFALCCESIRKTNVYKCSPSSRMTHMSIETSAPMPTFLRNMFTSMSMMPFPANGSLVVFHDFRLVVFVFSLCDGSLSHSLSRSYSQRHNKWNTRNIFEDIPNTWRAFDRHWRVGRAVGGGLVFDTWRRSLMSPAHRCCEPMCPTCSGGFACLSIMFSIPQADRCMQPYIVYAV